MKEQDRNKAWGFTLFGDDLRQELGGKFSFMGLYNSDMIFPSNISFPITLSKFCAFIMYYEAKGAVEGDITLKVTFGPDEKSIVEYLVSRNELIDHVADAPRLPDDLPSQDKERIFHARFPIVLSPFTIPTTGRLRVRAHYLDGSVLKLGSVAIHSAPAERFDPSSQTN